MARRRRAEMESALATCINAEQAKALGLVAVARTERPSVYDDVMTLRGMADHMAPERQPHLVRLNHRVLEVWALPVAAPKIANKKLKRER